MQNLFHRVTQLLGRSIDDPAIDELADHLGVTPHIILTSEKNIEMALCLFPGHGISVQCLETRLHRRWMTVCFGLVNSEDRFRGKLPFKLLPTDARKDVQRKLNIVPTPVSRIPYYRRNRPDNEMLNFDLPPFEAYCGFGDSEPYTLSMIGVQVPDRELADIMLARYDSGI